jgi:hypothetical protein
LPIIHAACATASEALSWFEKLIFADDKCARAIRAFQGGTFDKPVQHSELPRGSETR